MCENVVDRHPKQGQSVLHLSSVRTDSVVIDDLHAINICDLVPVLVQLIELIPICVHVLLVTQWRISEGMLDNVLISIASICRTFDTTSFTWVDYQDSELTMIPRLVVCWTKCHG